MIINELLKENPQVGDAIDLECGDVLIETHIEDITADGIVVKLDETALRMIMNERKEYIAESQKSKTSILEGSRYNPDGSPKNVGLAAAKKFGKKQDKKTARHHFAHDMAKDDLSKFKDDKKQGVAEGSEPELGTVKANLMNTKQPTVQVQVFKHNTLRGDSYWVTKGIKKFKTMDQAQAYIDRINKQGVAEGHYGWDDPQYDEREPERDEDWEYERWRQNKLDDQDDDQDSAQDVKEAEYQGRKVSLGKPMAGDVKKSKVYVKGPKGNVVKVNFGDKNMRIKKSNPNRRKSFRARHNCDNPGPRWKARYWSCRAW